jgi:bifunctional DNA-binding transcriptional regulator/antitoxin component of YhaV-PrlF toxin-antitoxin module
MRTTINSKGQITIPADAWEKFGRDASDPWEGLNMTEIMDELRGPIELPA